jgi:hypothetical protein
MVCFLLFGIVGMADGVLGLNHAATQQFLHGLIARLLLQLEHGMKRLCFNYRIRSKDRRSTFVLTSLRAFNSVFHAISMK